MRVPTVQPRLSGHIKTRLEKICSDNYNFQIIEYNLRIILKILANGIEFFLMPQRYGDILKK